MPYGGMPGSVLRETERGPLRIQLERRVKSMPKTSIRNVLGAEGMQSHLHWDEKREGVTQ